ncbi:GntR family transcriptional regulator [Novosphingobium sp. PhB165]|uniref:GntR family transcriptional regulator n=1 Tax=Novosphingobium sp. PhB165 TaxID=2485105 RepID=UPI0010D9D368|nr:GntR family transcriptional regulator [Novosphingobium sp. PhB165]TCM20804.1 GntR family transcriptional regulator [Novosphingobium sp. PhB165]
MDERDDLDEMNASGRLKPGRYVIISLRRMIANGTFKPGERIGEVATAEALGVSRMPVRTALRALEAEGLVEKLGARGYTARVMTAADIHGAIEVRGVLEGLAARRVAARGLSAHEEAQFSACLAEGEAIFAKGYLAAGDLDLFHDYNQNFHALLVEASGNPSIAQALARNDHLPFASASALALESDPASEYMHLLSAHHNHCEVMDAILRMDPDRAERNMREHARAAVGSERLFRRFMPETA